MESGVDGSIRPTVESGIERNFGEVNNIRVGSETVRVSFAEFSPSLSAEEKERSDPSKAIVYLPGWPFKADQPITFGIPSNLATRSGVRTFSIDTRVIKKSGPDTLYLEAEGIARFLHLIGIKGVTIVGHSEGTIRAVNLAAILEKDNPESVNGVVLINPMGIDNRNLKDLIKGFVINSFRVAPEERKKPGAVTLKGEEKQFVQGLWRDIALYGGNYLRTLKSQLRNLVTVNPYLGEIKAPVVIMATDRDLISDLRQYLPTSEVGEKLPPSQPEQELNEWVGHKWNGMKPEDQAEYGSKEAFMKQYLAFYRRREEMARLSQARQQYLKEKLLPQAQEVVFLVGTKHADHGGIHDSRPEKAAHIIYKIFDRLRRPKL